VIAVVLGIDTNVLVRLLVADDASQTRRARSLVDRAAEAGDSVLVSLPVIIETEWVLRSRYAFDKQATIKIIVGLLAARELVFEDEPALEEALHRWKGGTFGFVDCLIAAHNRRLGCAATATFDVAAARLPGFVPA
jgi:predicted nucleic-acid-binding protein